MRSKKVTVEGRLRKQLKDKDKIINFLSNKRVVKGLISALEDVKKGDYVVLTN